MKNGSIVVHAGDIIHGCLLTRVSMRREVTH